MVLTDCRDQLDSYGIDTALKYLDNKLSENAIKRLQGENTMFAEVGLQLYTNPSHPGLLICLFAKPCDTQHTRLCPIRNLSPCCIQGL